MMHTAMTRLAASLASALPVPLLPGLSRSRSSEDAESLKGVKEAERRPFKSPRASGSRVENSIAKIQVRLQEPERRSRRRQNVESVTAQREFLSLSLSRRAHRRTERVRTERDKMWNSSPLAPPKRITLNKVN